MEPDPSAEISKRPASKVLASGAKPPLVLGLVAFDQLWDIDAACCGRDTPAEEASNLEMQQDELTALAAIYERELSIVHRNEEEQPAMPVTSVDGSNVLLLLLAESAAAGSST